MLRFTNGPPDEMQVWIACGIATYLIVFALGIASAVVCGVLLRRTQTDGEGTAGSLAGVTTTGPEYGQQRDVATATPRTVPGLGAAA